MKSEFNQLQTDFEKQLTDTPYSQHPRPQFKREN